MSIEGESQEEPSIGRPYTCDACGSSFKHEDKILSHIQSFHADSTSTSYHMNEYSKYHDKSRPYSCGLCGKSFKQRHHLAEHELYIHTTARPYNCSECDQTFKLKRDLKNHEARVHKIEVLFECSECDLKSASKKFLRAHLSRDHKKKKKIVRINTLKEIAAGGDNEKIGVQTDKDVPVVSQNHEAEAPVQTKRKVSYSCVLCDAKFRLKSELQQHKIFVHKQKKMVQKKVRLLSCTRCGESFKQRRTLEKHLSDPNSCGTKQSTSSNVIDNKVFRKKSGAKELSSGRAVGGNKTQKQKVSAKRRNTGGVRPYRCDECGNLFKQAGHLHEHLLYVHGDERPFGCTECDRTFKRGRSLRMHMLSNHGKIVPYMCRECGAAFKEVQFLRRHSLTAHGKKLHGYQRDVPEKNVLRPHNPNKPFRCGKCGATFEMSVSLSTHFKKEHATFTEDKKAYTDELGNSSGEDEESFSSSSDDYQNRRGSDFSVSIGNRMDVSANGESQSYRCPACSELFEEYGALIEHARNCKRYILHANRENAEVIRSKREYGCNVCDVLFDGSRLFNTHLEEKHGTGLFVHYCDFTEKMCSTPL